MLLNDKPQVLTQVNRAALALIAIQRSEIESERDSSHMALIMPNASATPMPNIHVKYHIVVLPVAQ
jgi:hypothetical protein